MIKGNLYLVSSLGATGTRSEIKTDLASIAAVVRQNTSVPCAIGLGSPFGSKCSAVEPSCQPC